MPYKYPRSPEVIKAQNERAAKWRKNNPEKARRITKNQNLKKSFGITLEEYERMHTEQNGLCAICQKPEKYLSKNPQSGGQLLSLAVDHNHETNRVRALLCMDCNKGLGCFGDNIPLLLAAIQYLKTHGGSC